MPNRSTDSPAASLPPTAPATPLPPPASTPPSTPSSTPLSNALPNSLSNTVPVPPAWRWKAALAVLLVAAFALRAWMGSAGLEVGRFWDERYSLENAAVLVEEGRLAPANAYHPSLAHLPQAAVLGAARALCAHTALCDDPVVRRGRMTPLGYLLSRWLQALYGVLSLLVLYRVGRHLFGPAEGLLAALLLATVPWHIRQSAIAKPDILLLLTVTIAFGAALWVVQRPTLRRHLVGGLAVGLAAAAKYNGATAGIPLLVATVAGARREPRRVAWLLAAAATALAVFLLLDLHLLLDPQMLLHDFGLTLQHYERQGARAGASGPALLAHAVTSLLSPAFHGPLVGGAALLGLVLVGASAARSGLPRAAREGRWMLASFPPLYALVYAAATNNPSPHNWLPVTPFTSLAAAWLGVAAWRRLAAVLLAVLPGGLAAPRRQEMGAALFALVGVVALVASIRYVYPETLPTTVRQAEAWVLDRLPRRLQDRLVLVDPWQGWTPGFKRGTRNKACALTAGGAEELERLLPGVDAAVVRLDRDAVPDLASVLPGAEVHRFAPGFLSAWGPPLAVVVRPWRPAAAPRLLEGSAGTHPVTAEALAAAAAVPGAQISFSFTVAPGGSGGSGAPSRAGGPSRSGGPVRVRFAGAPVRVCWERRIGGRDRFVTERLPLPTTAGPWTLRFGGGGGEQGGGAALQDVRLLTWLPPAAAAGPHSTGFASGPPGSISPRRSRPVYSR